jgi:hypothetical protein
MKNLEKFLGVIVIGTVITTGAFAQETQAAEQAVTVERAAPAGGVGAVKMALSVDLFPLVKGIIWTDSDKDRSLFAFVPSFEYRVRPHYTVGVTADIYSGQAAKFMDKSVNFTYLVFAVHGRYYLQSAGMDKFFIDAGLGFNTFSVDLPSEMAGNYDFDYTGLTLSLKAGYKLMLTPSFFLEPSMAYVYAKVPDTSGLPGGVSVDLPSLDEWQPGLGIGGMF